MRTKIIEGGEGVAQEILDVSFLKDFSYIKKKRAKKRSEFRLCMTTLLCQNSLMQMDIKSQLEEQKDQIHGFQS